MLSDRSLGGYAEVGNGLGLARGEGVMYKKCQMKCKESCRV